MKIHSSYLSSKKFEKNFHYKRTCVVEFTLTGNKGSGRSTLVKQLRIHYGDSFPTPVRKFLIPIITANLADAVVCVVRIMQNSGIKIADSYVQVSRYY